MQNLETFKIRLARIAAKQNQRVAKPCQIRRAVNVTRDSTLESLRLVFGRKAKRESI